MNTWWCTSSNSQYFILFKLIQNKKFFSSNSYTTSNWYLRWDICHINVCYYSSCRRIRYLLINDSSCSINSYCKRLVQFWYRSCTQSWYYNIIIIIKRWWCWYKSRYSLTFIFNKNNIFKTINSGINRCYIFTLYSFNWNTQPTTLSACIIKCGRFSYPIIISIVYNLYWINSSKTCWFNNWYLWWYFIWFHDKIIVSKFITYFIRIGISY